MDGSNWPARGFFPAGDWDAQARRELLRTLCAVLGVLAVLAATALALAHLFPGTALPADWPGFPPAA